MYSPVRNTLNIWASALLQRAIFSNEKMNISFNAAHLKKIVSFMTYLVLLSSMEEEEASNLAPWKVTLNKCRVSYLHIEYLHWASTNIIKRHCGFMICTHRRYLLTNNSWVGCLHAASQRLSLKFLHTFTNLNKILFILVLLVASLLTNKIIYVNRSILELLKCVLFLFWKRLAVSLWSHSLC